MKYLFLFVMLIFSFSSCRKETTTAADNPVEYLSQWKLYSIFLPNGGGGGSTNYFEDENYLIRFLTDSTLESNNLFGSNNSQEDDWTTYGYDSSSIYALQIGTRKIWFDYLKIIL